MKHIAIFFTVLLFGCATTYQPNGLSGGFSETQLDTNVFVVSFKGNGYTDEEKASDFALLRSAEIAINNGFKYFTIVDSKNYSKESSYTTPIQSTTSVNSNTYGSAYVYGNKANLNLNTNGTVNTTISGGETYIVSKPRASNTIICFNDKPEGFSYNAELILKSIKAKYAIQ